MKRFGGIVSLLFSFLFLVSCSDNSFIARRDIDHFELLKAIPVGTEYDKAIYSAPTNSVFALNKASQEIHIYRDGKRINSIGGLGFERTNFQRLNDIGIDTDGGLLALDKVNKVLRKFTAEGLYISELKFDSINQPELFCIGNDGTIFVYDSTSSELISISPLDSKELYRFGRFQIEQPINIDCNNDYLFAYNAKKNTTYVFYLYGQYKETLTGQFVYDSFNHLINVDDIYPLIGLQIPPKLMTTGAQILTLLYPQEIYLVKIAYTRGSDATP
ncbi:MAG: hypothetical protein LHW47_03695 [Candidatus Cloacimonetes bacterium]|jgi:WD40 repeat protein|nr:hypothetical protein [Candidatus Cloacimonadota bacterium]